MNSNYKFTLSVSLIMLAAIVLFVLSVLGLFSPLQQLGLEARTSLLRPLESLSSKINSVSSLFSDLQGIRLENAELKTKLAETMAQLDLYKDFEAQNLWLKNQLNLVPKTANELTLAKVIKYELFPSAGYVFAQVDDPAYVRVGDFVGSYRYVVGQVTEMYGNFIKIRLFTSSDTEIAVSIGNNGALGNLRGNSGLNFKIDRVDIKANIQVGDEVKILNTMGIVLPSYVVGKVSKVSNLDIEGVKEVQIESPIDFQNLQYILILPNHD